MYNFELIWPGLAMSDQEQLICDWEKDLSTDYIEHFGR